MADVPRTGPKQKVLLIEDDPFMVSLLAQGLKNDFEMLLATDGDDAVKKFREHKPDLLLIDILLPHKNGIEALREIRQTPEGAKVPAIILTNLEEPRYMDEAQELHAYAYLIKANTLIPEIVAKVKEALKQ